jgi:hypothetical protein
LVTGENVTSALPPPASTFLDAHGAGSDADAHDSVADRLAPARDRTDGEFGAGDRPPRVAGRVGEAFVEGQSLIDPGTYSSDKTFYRDADD